jgi:peptide/nickel transport system permease protein
MRATLKLFCRLLLRTIPVLLLVSLLSMLLIDLAPGSPAHVVGGENADAETIAAINEQYGFNDPPIERYINWLGGALRFDFGESYRTKQPVSEMIMDRLPVTLELVTLSLAVALALAVGLGLLTAYRAGTRVDRVVRGATSAVLAAPPFLIALLLVYFFAVRFEIFPVLGWVPFGEDPVEHVRSLILPVLALSIGEFVVLQRALRADMIETLREDYILAATARGMSTPYTLIRHATRPSSFSLVTLAGISLGRLIGSAVIIESIFAIPGMGQLILQSIQTKDVIVVQGLVLVTAALWLLINLVVDLLYPLLDPRLRGRPL